MKTLPAVDVVIIGGGWTGLLMAKELGSRTALSVVVLERGVPRKTEGYADDMDELTSSSATWSFPSRCRLRGLRRALEWADASLPAGLLRIALANDCKVWREPVA